MGPAGPVIPYGENHSNQRVVLRNSIFMFLRTTNVAKFREYKNT